MTTAAPPLEPVSRWRDARLVIDNLILAALYVLVARAGLRLDAVRLESAPGAGTTVSLLLPAD